MLWRLSRTAPPGLHTLGIQLEVGTGIAHGIWPTAGAAALEPAILSFSGVRAVISGPWEQKYQNVLSQSAKERTEQLILAVLPELFPELHREGLLQLRSARGGFV